jgi:predicted molibdopterin-dependent oxidoreductase YjgC
MSDQKRQDTMPATLPPHPMPGIFPTPPGPLPVIPPAVRRKRVDLTIDGRQVSVPEGTTLLEATRQLGIDTPTLCFLETLTPINVCRMCVVEVEGSRTLVPACSRKVEPGMVVRTDTERVRLSRRLVLEFLGSSVDVSTAPQIQEYMVRYGAHPERFGPCAAPRTDRDAAPPGRYTPTDGSRAATVGQPVKIDNELYVRDYSKCILCCKCAQACGTEAQNTFAIAVAGRGFDARISTEYSVPLPESACVYCGNCIAVCPTGALMFSSEYEMRQAGTWNESRQTSVDTICTYCGVGCTIRLHVQDNRIVKATSPLDHDITRGNLCIKGRFGWQFVHGSDTDLEAQP